MIWGSKPIFSWSRNQINTLGSTPDHYCVCIRTKTIEKNSKMAANFTLYFGKCFITSLLFAIERWFWCLNLSFHVWGFLKNTIKMIGGYLILYHDINDEKVAKLMTIAKSNIDDMSKSGPSNTIFVEFASTSFGKESNKAVSSIAEHYWMSMATNDIKISSK